MAGCRCHHACTHLVHYNTDAGETRRLSSTLDDIRTMVDGECNVYCAQQRILCRSTSLGTMFKESDAAVEASTEVVRNAKRTLRRTVGSATESPSVHGGHSAAGEDSGTEDTPAATSSGAASGSARRWYELMVCGMMVCGHFNKGISSLTQCKQRQGWFASNGDQRHECHQKQGCCFVLRGWR